MINLVNENIGKPEIDELIEWLKTYPRLTKGPLTVEFEKKWSEFIGCKHSVFVNSGSSANLIALATLKLCYQNRNNKVVLPTLCWATDYAPLIQLGFDPIFCDINLRDLSLDLDELETIFKTQKPAALLLVSVLGLVPNMNHIEYLCKKYNVTLIQDHCESFGSKYDGERLGSTGFCSTFSTYFGHHISTIEGGMVCTDSDEFYEYLLMMRSHGWNRDLSAEGKEYYSGRNKFHEAYTFHVPGFNLRATDLQAFIGINQLDKAEKICEDRNHLFKTYMVNMPRKAWKPVVSDSTFTSAFAYPVIFDTEKQLEKAIELMSEHNIECRPLISGSMPDQPIMWSEMEVHDNRREYKAVDQVDKYGMYLPCHPDMKDIDVIMICELVKQVYSM
jgi:CDP-6-deoxy-D-xylo-4-hexulose-3-dehydrase